MTNKFFILTLLFFLPLLGVVLLYDISEPFIEKPDIDEPKFGAPLEDISVPATSTPLTDYAFVIATSSAKYDFGTSTLAVYGTTTIQTPINTERALLVLNSASTTVFQVDTLNASTTVGGTLNVVSCNGCATGFASQMNELSDVTLTSTSSAHILQIGGTGKWVNNAISGDATISNTGVLTVSAGALDTLNEIADVTLTSTSTSNILRINGTGKWVNSSFGFFNSDDLGDITITSSSTDQLLTINGTGKWQNSTFGDVFTVNNLGDVNISTSSADIFQVGGSGKWVANAMSGDATISNAGVIDVTINNDDWSGTDLSVANGGTGASTLTDGGVLLGQGTGAIEAMAVLANGAIIVGDGTTDPVALTAFTSSTGDLLHEAGGLEFDASAVTTGDLIRGASAGNMSLLTVGASSTILTAIGTNVGYTADPAFASLRLTSDGLLVTSGGIEVTGGGINLGTTTPSAGFVASSTPAYTGEFKVDSSANITIDWTLGDQANLKLVHDSPTVTMSGGRAGQPLRLVLCQDDTGGRNVNSWGANVLFSGGATTTMTTHGGACDVISFLATQSTSTFKYFAVGITDFGE